MDFHFALLAPMLRIVVLVLLIVFAVVALTVVIMIAALPARIAIYPSHPQRDTVNVCDWVRLSSGILWVPALAWVFRKPLNRSEVTEPAQELFQTRARQVARPGSGRDDRALNAWRGAIFWLWTRSSPMPNRPTLPRRTEGRWSFVMVGRLPPIIRQR